MYLHNYRAHYNFTVWCNLVQLLSLVIVVTLLSLSRLKLNFVFFKGVLEIAATASILSLFSFLSEKSKH